MGLLGLEALALIFCRLSVYVVFVFRLCPVCFTFVLCGFFIDHLVHKKPSNVEQKMPTKAVA